jgi:hypothetical protein
MARRRLPCPSDPETGCRFDDPAGIDRGAPAAMVSIERSTEMQEHGDCRVLGAEGGPNRHCPMRR